MIYDDEAICKCGHSALLHFRLVLGDCHSATGCDCPQFEPAAPPESKIGDLYT